MPAHVANAEQVFLGSAGIRLPGVCVDDLTGRAASTRNQPLRGASVCVYVRFLHCSVILLSITVRTFLGCIGDMMAASTCVARRGRLDSLSWPLT